MFKVAPHQFRSRFLDRKQFPLSLFTRTVTWTNVQEKDSVTTQILSSLIPESSDIRRVRLYYFNSLSPSLTTVILSSSLPRVDPCPWIDESDSKYIQPSSASPLLTTGEFP